MTKYQPKEFEKKWIEEWEKKQIYKTEEPNKQKEKMYTLVMFPYPSGDGLHVGHVRVYTGTDVLARFFRMKGYAVLNPMGWDAFGLPAENAAIKAQKNPMDLVPKNIATFKRQMQMLGFSYDWNRELSTTDPKYYGITQWLFIQFYKMGLLYKKETPVYYCPFCRTGLAEEEVLPNGTHERCGNVIARKSLPQWIFRITTYADSLLQGLKGLDWPKGILEMQKNWIGKKEGINITYDVVDAKGTNVIASVSEAYSPALYREIPLRSSSVTGIATSPTAPRNDSETITCFTTRPDTNFGATFLVLAPEHEFVQKILSGCHCERSEAIPLTRLPRPSKKCGARNDNRLQEIKQYVEKSLAKTDLERIAEGRKKTGVFTGFYALNKLTNKLMPIWVSDFVLSEFGTGAVVGVPGHDLRDYDFAKEFGLEIIRVVVGADGDKSEIKKREQVQEETGKMINSGFLDGMDIHKATKKIMDYIEEKNWGRRVVSYHLRDWIFSRQRYWGEPIPMVYCKKCAHNKMSYWKRGRGEGKRVKRENHEKKDQTNNNLDHKISERVEEIESSMYGWFPLDENSLPLELPYLKHYEPVETGESPLSKVHDWVKVKCPNCGGEGRRETDTMPNWAGSCWYFLAFAFWGQNRNSVIASTPDLILRTKQSRDESSNVTGIAALTPFARNDNVSIKKWLPVDWYIGGAEHAVLHLLYSRFWMHILNDMGLIAFREPFMRLRNVGMVLAEDHHKMSKSYGNVINPDKVALEYGADSLRLYEMFMAPFNQEIAWSTKTLAGTYRFLTRIWQIYHNPAYLTKDKKEEVKNIVVELQRTVSKVTKDIMDVKYNTAIAAMMEFLNVWQKNGKLSNENAKKFLQILAPFAPFIAEEIWHEVFHEKSSIHNSEWPEINELIVVETEVTIPVQVNGKLRGIVKLANKDLEEKKAVEEAMKIENICKWLKDKKYKIIYVKGKILNFIID